MPSKAKKVQKSLKIMRNLKDLISIIRSYPIRKVAVAAAQDAAVLSAVSEAVEKKSLSISWSVIKKKY